MVYLLTFISAITSVIGNVTAKYWADSKGTFWMTVTICAFLVSTISYTYSLRIGGQFTLVNALFYAIVPIITVLLGFFLFHDRVTTLQAVGLGLSFIAIVLFTIEGKVELPR